MTSIVCDDLDEKEPLPVEEQGSDERGVCGYCGDDYEPYMLMIMKGTVNIAEFVRLDERYGWLCPSCRCELTHGGEFAMTRPSD